MGASYQEGCFEVVDYGERIGVYSSGWGGRSGLSKRRATRRYFRLVAEPLPGEGSIREFIEAMFGGPGGPYDRESSGTMRSKLNFWQRCADWLRG